MFVTTIKRTKRKKKGTVGASANLSMDNDKLLGKLEDEKPVPTHEEIQVQETFSFEQNELLEKFQSQKASKRRPTMDETHKRATFLVNEELLMLFNEYCHRQGRGFKTFAINLAISEFLSIVEEEKAD